MLGRRLPALVAALAVAALAACGGDDTPSVAPPSATASTIEVTSTAFADGGPIPTTYGCEGDGAVPPLSWSTGGAAVRAWAVVVSDPDAPSGTFVHWVVADIPAAVTQLDGVVPDGAVEAQNSRHQTGWTPPCPPSGTHRYRFTVYALSTPTGLSDGAATADALAAIGDVAIDEGVLVGTYGTS